MKSKYFAPRVLLLLLVGESATQPTVRAEDVLPAFPHRIALDIVLPHRDILTYEPVIVRVSLTNLDRVPIELDVRKDGAPYAMVSMIARGKQDYFVHDQRIRRSGPELHGISLKPGETTSGEILVLFGVPTGFAFSDPGIYRIQFAFQPDPKFASVLSNEFKVTAVPDDRGNRALLVELSELAYEKFGYDRELIRRSEGDQILIGYELVRSILVHQEGVGASQDEASRQKQTKLLKSLSQLIERYPNASYTPYLARYLGLVEINTFENEVSLANLDERDVSSEERRKRPSYVAALKYLTIAVESNCWPRRVAPTQLTRLHLLAHEWDKAEAFISKMRADYAEVGGDKEADRLTEDMENYRNKLARRRTSEGHE